MNIDERLEALTQSVELLASFHRDNEAAMRKLDEKLSEKIDKLTDNIDRIAQLVLPTNTASKTSRLAASKPHPEQTSL